MRKLVTTAVAALALSAAITATGKPAVADATNIVTLAQSGYWTTYSLLSDNGIRSCQMRSGNPTKSFYVKWFDGRSTFSVQMFDDSWRLPKGQKYGLTVVFDRTVFSTEAAVSEMMRYDNGTYTGVLEFKVQYEVLDKFIAEFANADVLTIQYASSSDTIDMTGSRVAGKAFIDCIRKTVDETPFAKTVPLPIARAEAPPNVTTVPKTTASRDSIPIIVSPSGSAIHIDVLLGGLPIRMLVDTGAMSSQIPQTFASMLLRNGSAVDAGTTVVRYANGSKAVERVIRIRELRVGSHVVRDVEATISDGPPLIGFPVINGIAPFTIDTRVGELIWHNS
jgi:hypothetical protein